MMIAALLQFLSCVQELDDLRAAVKRMKSEIFGLTSDKANLQQQVDSRSQHCMTLISENKRALNQASEVRQQMSGLQLELTDSKRELRAAGVALLQRKPLVCKVSLPMHLILDFSGNCLCLCGCGPTT